MAADLSQASATRKKGSVRKEAAFFWSAAARSYAAQRAGSTGKRSRRHGARFDRVHRQRDRAERAGQRPEMRRRHLGAVPRDIHIARQTGPPLRVDTGQPGRLTRTRKYGGGGTGVEDRG